ncbi:MAG: leucine-rich repeat domain-containing protein [Lachnospiraceae bacterium]|nr:leucine-rich repeat domain-containing protein [Lachnospiraceae bacterium]
MRKKWICLLTAAVLAVSAVGAGCGGTNQDSETGNTGGSETTVSGDENGEDTATTENVQTAKTEITLADVLSAPESPTEDFAFSVTDGGWSVEAYYGTDEIVVLPEEVEGEPVVRVGRGAFINDSAPTVRAVRLSDSVKTLEDGGSFINNETIEIVVAGSGLEEIGESVFQNCASLNQLVLNDGLVEISSMAILNCPSLKELEIPDSVETIGSAGIYNVAEDFVLYGAAGSAAETYAEEYGLTFQAID